MNGDKNPIPSALYDRGVQRPAGRGPVRGRPTPGAQNYAKTHGYVVAREYVDEVESWRVVDRPQIRRMIEERSQPTVPLAVILV